MKTLIRAAGSIDQGAERVAVHSIRRITAGGWSPLSCRVLVVVGTRPEAIKLAPVIRRLRREPETFSVTI